MVTNSGDCLSTEASRLRHRFQDAARRFRAGRLSLAEFTDAFFPVADARAAESNALGEPLPKLPARPVDCHKGDFGHVLVIAGSRSMPGAAALAGLAALRSGAGLVTVATSEPAQPIVARFHPCLMTAALPAGDQGELTTGALREIMTRCERATCVAIGPGLGQSRAVRELVRVCFRQIGLPMVVDADGLNALAGEEGIPVPGGPRIYTPHVGELRRLIHTQSSDRDDLEHGADEWILARQAKSPQILLLKGHRTYITDGKRAAENASGSPAMATAGAGDVLTGLIAALLAQGLKPWDAARLAAYLHGIAGEMAADEIGPVGVVATDLIERLPVAIRAHGLAQQE
jgi:NAD(P)H-hydrate epimerase